MSDIPRHPDERPPARPEIPPSGGSEGPTLDPSSTGRGFGVPGGVPAEAGAPTVLGGAGPGGSGFGGAGVHDAGPGEGIGERPGTLVGPFRLLSVIGEGGFGVVWVAEQREPISRRVALKVIKPGMDTRAVVARFEQERQALALMDHPNVARVYDAGATSEGRPYFAMEYVQGVAITEFCDRAGYSVRQRLELFIPVCEAVQHAHSKGIIHRDIKPSNVLVEVVDGRPVPKVIDFGVAKALSHTLTEKTLFTEVGQIVGTPEYMSPEQAGLDSIDVDTRTDVYSLGVLLYELLTGSLPFDPRTLRSGGYAEIQRIIREVDPPNPSVRLSSLGPAAVEIARRRGTRADRLTGELRRELEWIPLRAMRKERAERYRTPVDLADDVRKYLDGQPLSAGPESRAYRARKFVRRNRGAVTTGAIVALGVALGLVGTTYGLVEARRGYAAARAAQARAETEAERARQEASRAEGVNRVVERMLSRAAPEFSGRIDLSLGYILRVTVGGIERGVYAAAPEVEAGLRSALGVGFQGLGDFASAEKQFRKAVELERNAPLRSEGRLGHRETQLAGALIGVGKLREGKTILDEAIATLDSAKDATPWDRRDARITLGGYYERTGAFARADEAYTAIEQDLAGAPDAGPGARQAVRELRAQLALRLGKSDEALAWYRESVTDLRPLVDQKSTLYADALRGLGIALRQAGKWDEAEGALRESLAITDEAFGADNAFSAWSKRVLGGVMRDVGKAAEAEGLERSALEVRRRVFGSKSLAAAQSLDGWAGALVDLGRLEEAEAAYREAAAIREAVLGGDALDVAVPLTGLADVLTREGKGEEAVTAATRALGLRRAGLPGTHWMIASTRSVLGGALTSAGRLDDAEKELLGAYEVMKDDPGASKRRLPEVVKRLVALYAAWGKADERARWERVDQPAPGPPP